MFRAGTLLAICIGATAPVMTVQTLVQINSRDFLQSSLAARIINGSEVRDEAGKYSYFALPTANNNTDQWLGCGASIISPTWGLTAAHCFGGGMEACSQKGNISLWMGDLHLSAGFLISGMPGGRHVRVAAEIVCHPQFDGKCSHGHDMTLLRLKDPLPSWVKPVPLHLGSTLDAALGQDPLQAGPTRGTANVGEVTTNIGFGYTESSTDIQSISDVPAPKMREADLTIFANDHKACASVYAGGYGCSDPASEDVAKNLDQQLCAGATDNPQRDTCDGDSGSPMLDKHGVQIGIVSYGGGPGEKMKGPGRMCADPNYMGIYTRVSAFSDFIHSHVKDLPMD